MFNKILFLLLLTFCVSIAKAQPSQYTPMTAAGYQMKRIKTDSTLHIPSFCGTPTLRGSTAFDGAIALDTCNNVLYKWTHQAGWTTVSGGAGGSQNLQSVLDLGNSSYNRDINLYGRSSSNQIYLSGLDNNWMPFMALGDSIGGAVYTYTYPQATIEFQNQYQSQKLKQQDSIRATIYLPTQVIDATDTLATLSDVRNQDLQQVTDLGNTTTNDIQLINDANVILGSGGGVLLDNSSKLKEGTIDAGYGGSKGAALICAVGYELKWEAGRLYVMNDGGTSIREVRYTFGYTPTAFDDISKGFYVGSRWVLDNGDVYVCSDNTDDDAVWALQTTNATDTTSLSDRIDLRVKYSDTATMLSPYFRTIDTTNKWVNSVTKLNDSTIRVIKNTTTTDITLSSISTSVNATRLITTVYNNSGTTIPKGSVVYINGRHSSNLPTVALAQANSEDNSYKTFAIVENDITTSNSGIVIQAGNIGNLNLPTSSYTDGDIVYLSPTVNGGITTTKPSAPNHICKLGSVTRAHPTFGSIEVKIENCWQMDELSDVKIALVPNDSTLLQFSRVDSLWHDVSVVNAIGTKYIKPSDTSVFLRKTDSSTYYTKYRSDTSRTNIYNAITPKFTTPTGWTDYFSSSTILGGTGASGVINYIVMGKILFVQINISITSNASNFSFTLPYTNGTNPQFGSGRGLDQTNTQVSVGMYMAASTNVVTCLRNNTNITTPNSWQITGTKSCQGFLMLNIP